MLSLQAIPKSWVSWDYDVFCEDQFLCTIDLAWLREAGSFQISTGEYEIRREPMWGAFVLSEDGRELARATKPSAFTRVFALSYGGQEYDLRAASPFQRSFILSREGTQFGLIRPGGLFSRKISARLPESFPGAVQAFVLWLVIAMWRRQAAANSS